MGIKVRSVCVNALKTHLVEIEASFMRGFTGVQLIGHTSEVCRNGLERAKAAVESLGLRIPQRKIVLNLSPADIKADGSQLDLAFALALALLVKDDTKENQILDWVFSAELGLDGQLKPTKHCISFAIESADKELRGMVVAWDNYDDLISLKELGPATFGNFSGRGFRHLSEVLDWLPRAGVENDHPRAAQEGKPPPIMKKKQVPLDSEQKTFDDMVLSSELRLAALVTAVGFHNLLICGTPGSGKSMFAARLPSIMPALDRTTIFDCLKIYSSNARTLQNSALSSFSPFRSPHHQASSAAILGTPDNPGELSLAHGGILFFDEFPEFRRDIIESLREPLETGSIEISRARQKVNWPCKVCLVAACNLCPCGWFGSQKRPCQCPSSKILAYRRKMSGPILDRIDLHLNLFETEVKQTDLFLSAYSQKSENLQTATMRHAVSVGRKFGQERNRELGVRFNSELPAKSLFQASGHEQIEFKKMVKDLIPGSCSQRSMLRSCLTLFTRFFRFSSDTV